MRLPPKRTHPDFTHGDTVKVWVKVREGEKERLQAYEGVVIARSGAGLMESFTVRKISYGEGVERVFPVLSPNIDRIEVLKRGKVRRAKLYYLRDRRGKSARIFEIDQRPHQEDRSRRARCRARGQERPRGREGRRRRGSGRRTGREGRRGSRRRCSRRAGRRRRGRPDRSQVRVSAAP